MVAKATGAGVWLLLAAMTAPAAAEDTALICLNAGHQYQVGDYACLPGCHGRQRYARCDALGPATTWTYISEVCPVALFSPPLPVSATLVVETAMSPIPYPTMMSAVAPEFEGRIAEAGRLASN